MNLGVIVAGGAGTRLEQGVPKAQVMLAGETLLDRAIATLAAVCNPIVTVTPRSRRPELLPSGGASLEWTEDAAGGEGPLSGLVAGLAAEPFDRAVVLGVDFPFVRAALLEALLAELDAFGAPAVIPIPDGVPQPLVAAYSRRAARALGEAFARGERSVTRAVMALGPQLLGDDRLRALDGGLENFFNLNTPEDLAAAERRITRRPGRRRQAPRAARRARGPDPV